MPSAGRRRAARGCRRSRRRSGERERVTCQGRSPGSAGRRRLQRACLRQSPRRNAAADALGEVERHIHVVLDHHDSDVARDIGEQPCTSRRSSTESRRKARRATTLSGLAPAPWRSRRGGAHHKRFPTAGAMRDVPARPVRAPLAPARSGALLVEPQPTGSSASAQPEQRQGHVAQQRIARKQRDDLIGARHPEMRAPAARCARDIATEQQIDAAVGRQSPVIRLNKVVLPAPLGPMIRRRSPGATSSRPRVTRSPPKDFSRPRTYERAHRPGSVCGNTARRCRALRNPTQKRTVPGTRPSGIRSRSRRRSRRARGSSARYRR